MRRLPLVIAVVSLVAGCEWDGPPHDVRVITSQSGGVDADADADVAAPDRGGAPVGDADGDRRAAPVTSDDPPSPGLENHPGSLGALSMPATVAVVGDSLTVAATDEIVAALTRAGVRAVVVDGKVSRRMTSSSRDLPSGAAAIETILGEHEPDLWVVALGTNDVGAGVQPERFVDDLRTTVAAIPRTAPLVWVDVWVRDRLEDVVEANTLLRAELGRRRAPTAVADWFSAGTMEGVITGDGIHLTQAGQDRFASAITDAVVALAVEAD